MFDSTKEDLKDIIKWADEGALQLPDFQRDYVWGDEDVKSLIASVAKGFPVGALLTLEVGGSVSFKPRLIQGVPQKEVRPTQLLLDGQQRITSLYQSCFGKKPVRTRNAQNKEIDRFYYIDIKKALDAGDDLENAIVGVPADKIVRKNFGRDIDIDLSTRENEFANCMFPLNQVFDSRDWFYGWRDYSKNICIDVYDMEKDFDRGVVDKISRYKMPIIKLDKSNSREAICLVFEKVNVGGKKLDAFELITAIYAADEFDLREDWYGDVKQLVNGRRARIIGIENRRDVLSQINSISFMQSCALLKTRQDRINKQKENPNSKDLPQISCKREALLALPLASYKEYADVVEKGFIEAAAFLNEHKIIWHHDVPYPSAIVTLASVFAILGRDGTSAAAKEKLSKWFWSIVFGELYGSSTETRLAIDVPQLVDWITGTGNKPKSMDEAIFQQERLKSMRSRLSAAYKGLHAITMRNGCLDFITGKPTDIMTFFNDKIDIHHIFPEDWCKKNNIPPSVYNSAINKTPLSKTTNIIISGHAPSKYLKRIEDDNNISPEQLDEILKTHLIDPAKLRADDFYGVFEDRSKKLSEMIASAMDKQVVKGAGTNEPEFEVQDLDSEELEEQI